jgi:hypothetical protein
MPGLIKTICLRSGDFRAPVDLCFSMVRVSSLINVGGYFDSEDEANSIIQI